MTVADGKAAALADARARNLPDLAPLIEALARALESLRKAEWNEDASDGARGSKR
jgi:hypothetical protein